MPHLSSAAGVDPYDKSSEAPYEMVSFTNSFHGRTLGALALTYKDQYKTPFAPIMPGAVMVPYMDLEAAAAVIKKVRWAAAFLLLLATSAVTHALCPRESCSPGCSPVPPCPGFWHHQGWGE